jgi:hypothetical protein
MMLEHAKAWLGFCFLFLFLVFFDFFLESVSGYAAQAGLELAILMPQPPECWDDRYRLPCQASGSQVFNMVTIS